MKPTQQYNHTYGIKNKNKNKDKHGVPPTKRFSLLGSLVARLEALPPYVTSSRLISSSSIISFPLSS